ncbi:MAG TPA: YbhB/YbcL family Raf kinase inhibitor-like protein [Bacteroidia bacterium]|nr:YbhB/YbcL family Raf kinase inhibitor-like protein [Bacteroidia bacterium]
MKKTFLAYLFSILYSLSFGQAFTLVSADASGNVPAKMVYNGYGCDGDNISPQLSWTNAPEGTRSFAVTMFDPDAPVNNGWWHWICFNIPAGVHELPSGAGSVEKKLAPEGTIQSMTDFGKPGYGGPCPPEGSDYHHYVITVYALKTDKLNLDSTAAPDVVKSAIDAGTIAKATLILQYKR